MESKVYKNWSATLYIPINHEKDLRAINGTSLSRDPSGTGQGDNPKAITLLSKISNLTVLVDRKFQGSSRRNVYRRGPTSTLLNHILKALPPMPLLRTLRTGIHDQAPIMIHTVHDSESCNIMKNIGDHASAWTTVRGLRLRQVGFGYRNQLDSGYYISDNNGRTSAYMPPLFIVNPIERYSIVRFIGHTYSKGNVKVAQWTPEEMIRVFPVPTPFLRHEFTQEWFEEQARLAGIMKCWFQRPEPGTDESLDTSGRDRYTFYDWPGILQIGSLFVIP
jgi:hypothetical protein